MERLEANGVGIGDGGGEADVKIESDGEGDGETCCRGGYVRSEQVSDDLLKYRRASAELTA